MYSLIQRFLTPPKLELTSLVQSLEAELDASRVALPREVEREVQRRIKPLTDKTGALLAEIDHLQVERQDMAQAHQQQVKDKQK